MRARTLPTLALVLGALGVAVGLGLGLYLAGDGERGRAARASASGGPSARPAADLSAAPRGDAGLADGARAGASAREAVATDAAEGATATDDFDPRAILGVVVDAAGEPIEGARLALFRGTERPRRGAAPGATQTTDERGRFRFDDEQERREARLVASAPGHETRLFLVAAGVDETLELEPAAPLVGRTLDAESGAPIADVEVRFRQDTFDGDGYSREARATTDSEGRFAFPLAPTDAVLALDLLRPGHRAERRELQVVSERREGYDVLLGSGPPYVLELVDARTGAALAELDVRLRDGVRARTDSSGAIELRVPSPERMRGSWLSYRVSADGYCETRGGIRLRGSGVPEAGRVPLLVACTVTGVVRDGDGAPVADAEVRVLPRGGRRGAELEGVDRWSVASLGELPRGVEIRDASGRPRTGPDGAFRLDGVLAGSKNLVVRAPDRPRAIVPVELTHPGAVVVQDVELSAGATVEGVVTVDGEPGSLRVRWNAAEGAGSARSNDRGEYRLVGVAPGEVTIRATLPRGVDPPEPVVVHLADGETRRVDLTLETDRRAIAGIVLDERGEPLPGITVDAAPEGDGKQRRKSRARAETDPTGAFVIEVGGAAETTYSVTASDGPRWASVDGVLPGTEDVELELALLGRVNVTVLDARTRLPVPAFRLYWKHAAAEEPYRMLWQSGREFEPAGDGSYVVDLPVGTLSIAIDATRDDYVPVEVRNVIVLDEGEPAEVLVRLEEVPRIVLRFRPSEEEEARRRPPARRIELATDEQSELLRRNDRFARLVVHRLQRVELNDRGDTVLRGIAPGSYVLRRSPSRLEFSPGRLEVPISAERRSFRVRWKDPRAAAPAEDSPR